jgi:hypothetical protein
MSLSLESPRKLTEPLASPSGKSTWGPAVFVWGVWALLLATGLLLVVKYHHHIPIWPGDDWARFFVWIAGGRPMTLTELWGAEVEHRLLLICVVGIGLLKASGGDYWSLALLYVTCMGVLSFAFLRAAKSVRGHASYTDAILPLSVFVGMWTDNLFVGNWLTYFAEAWVAGGMFVIMVRRGTQLTLSWGVLAAVLLILLPSGIGAGGPLYFPVLCLWLVYSVFASWRAGSLSGWQAAVILNLVAVALVILGLHFYGLVFTKRYPHPSLWLLLSTWIAWCTGSLGIICTTLWPYSGPPMALILLLSAAALAVTLWRGDARVRSRALGLAFYLAAISMFGLGFSWGRAGGAGTIVGLWYWPLATVVLPWFYFTWELCLPRAARQFAQMCLLAVLCMVVSQDVSTGVGQMANTHAAAMAIEEAIRQGTPPYILQGRYSAVLGDADLGVMAQLHQAGFGIFKDLVEDPPFRDLEPLPLSSAVAYQATWDGNTAQGLEPGAYLAIPIGEPRMVARVSLEGNGYSEMRMTWGRTENGQFVETGKWSALPLTGSTKLEGSIFIGDTINEIRIILDAHEVQLSKVVFTVPDT